MGYYTAMKNNYEDKEETTICNTIAVAKGTICYNLYLISSV